MDNMLDELAEKFSVQVDSHMRDSAAYTRAIKRIHEFAEHELTEEKAAELNRLVDTLTLSTFHSASKEGMKIGAKIIFALLSE